MKYLLKFSLSVVLFASLFMTGCSKSEDSTPSTPSTPGSQTPGVSFKDGYGALAAVKTVTYQTVSGFSAPIVLNTAVAAFPSSMGSGSSLVDAGNVSLNTKMLTKTSTNAYVYQTFTDPLVFNQFAWKVSGSGAVPAITYTDDRPMADFSGYENLPGTITKANGLTISLGSAITDADSVYVVITDYSNGYILKRVAGNAAQCEFSAAELSKLVAGQGMLQICPWNYKAQDFNDKRFYFVNESAYTKAGVTIN
jgi:hypothetical protein